MKILSIMNHHLNDEQVKALEKEFGKGIEIVELNEAQKKIWGSIPADATAEDVQTYIKPIINLAYKTAGSDNWLICTGDFTAFKLVTDLWLNDLPTKGLLLPTTERVSEEVKQKDGTTKKVSIFKHVRFRGFLS